MRTRQGKVLPFALIVCVIISMLTSCSPRIVEAPKVLTESTHTERVNVVRDTLVTRDSVFHYIQGDTVRIERWKYIYNNSVRVDTVVKVDSVEVPVKVTETIVETRKEVPKWIWVVLGLMSAGLLIIGIKK